MGARIARSENLDKAPEGAGWEDSYASKARSDGRFAQTSLFTSLRPGADGDNHRHRARILLSEARGADETVWRCLIQMIKMLIAPIIFCTVVHGIAGMEDLKRLRSRRHQGVDLFRGGDDARANCRPCHRQRMASRAGFGRRRKLRCAVVLSGRFYGARCSVHNFRVYGVRDALSLQGRGHVVAIADNPRDNLVRRSLDSVAIRNYADGRRPRKSGSGKSHVRLPVALSSMESFRRKSRDFRRATPTVEDVYHKTTARIVPAIARK